VDKILIGDKKMKIYNIIFDLGGVLINWSPEKCVYSLFGENKRSKELMKIVFKSDIWREMDRGKMNENIGRARIFNEYPEYKDDIIHLFDSYKPCLFPLIENIKIMEDLKKKGYKIYLLSNIFDEVWKYILANNNFFHNFDGMVLSYIEKTSKPDLDIYKILFNRYNLTPETCLYIDDSKENIISGKNLNLNTIHLSANENLAPEIKKFCL
jgi:putative hydrolase of the HAD superfamily